MAKPPFPRPKPADKKGDRVADKKGDRIADKKGDRIADKKGDRIADKKGDRIAKVLARAGIASRRDAERMIEDGRVRVNGSLISSPALDIGPTDRILVDGKPLPAPERPRLWLYHKPTGLVTTARDEKGRATIFDGMPPEMAQVNPVGRLDITSEGLILLTNDGALKRRLELPSTGWLRRYRVRINGSVAEAALERLRTGIALDDGTRFQPMEVSFDRQQGANAWLTVALREGKNREIRRAMEAIGVVVNRLIRVSYGPFQLGNLGPGEIEEIKPRVMRDQLGLGNDGKGPERPVSGGKPARGVRRDGADRRSGGATTATPAAKRGPAADARATATSGRRDKSAKPGEPPRRSGKAAPKHAAGPGAKPGTKPGTKPGSWADRADTSSPAAKSARPKRPSPSRNATTPTSPTPRTRGGSSGRTPGTPPRSGPKGGKGDR